MCGIVAARTAEPVAPILLGALKLLEYRGYDSAGVSIRTSGGHSATTRTIDRVESLQARVGAWSGAELPGTGIGHTRWATHGAVTERNAHPHQDCSGRLSLVHNGIIENAAALRHELEEKGHVFASEVDSEVIGHLVEEGLRHDDDLARAVTGAVAALEGSWAVVVLDGQTDRLVAAAHRSPLLVARSPRGVFAASDINAIGEWVEHFQAMRDGDVVELAEELVWSRGGLPAEQPPMADSVWTGASIGVDGHPDFMSKEIAEQPDVAARIVDRLAPHVLDGSLWTDLALPRFDRVTVIGCGTSLNAGRMIGGALSSLGRVPVRTLVASEAADAVMEPRTLVLALSQSGETADLLNAIEHLDLSRSSLVAITNNEHSTLARRADSVLTCDAGPEIGVAATKTFVAQVITGVAAALSALVASERMLRSDAVRHSDELRLMPELLAHAIAVSHEVLPSIVAGVLDEPGFLFLGQGTGVVLAAEGALKLKELSYRWAEHQPAGELKHGPLALVDRGTPVLVIDSGDPRIDRSIAEVDARGGRIVRIGGPGSTVPVVGLGRPAGPTAGARRWGPLEAVVPLQIFARDLALALGRDVDKPRNLAKSVTVE
ncbi:glutamine--fructose-6-phosphate transaminase (isomerizing) [Herbiconiux sp. VKM Ac-2851]|uniref:glutamine--fructose-6-phosphate transaminase (isomerizing) n=1 Tax=Herbiconiux sp. VKM Ac-2851 TaxID=2739025 RepID=UPI00156777D3|nr:glutamine--fructose-6-phosphate transaminase (isomerizing) [Herbiconiux sp. VKM Ac-2851]NQX33491.1 glutamine--fructose-6-phosphate transaminase (isomerizing) [Herbiconiux sp. VKM Ac-2851]